MDQSNAPSAIVVQRAETEFDFSVSELLELTKSYGYHISEVMTQVREEGVEYNIGSGKVSQILHTIRKLDIDALIVGNDLTPKQQKNILRKVPSNVTVQDRGTLIVDLFSKRSNSKEVDLLVEKARLEHSLSSATEYISQSPRVVGDVVPTESSVKEIRSRISSIKSELDSLKQTRFSNINKQKDEGFTHVSLVGYTNSGRSTLFRRLAQDHSVEENLGKHPDLPRTSESSEEMLYTIDTLTRRMDAQKRDILLTDGMGIIADLPPWVQTVYTPLFDSLQHSELVLIIVDLTDSIDTIRSKLVCVQEMIKSRSQTRHLTVFTKSDSVPTEERKQKLRALQQIAPNAISVSAITGENVDSVKEKVSSLLPPLQKRTLYMSLNSDRSQEIISWLHRNTHMYDQEYTDEGVTLTFEAQADIIRELHDRKLEKISGAVMPAE